MNKYIKESDNLRLFDDERQHVTLNKEESPKRFCWPRIGSYSESVNICDIDNKIYC